jgi:DNA-binding transcriptional LysR family regulator
MFDLRAARYFVAVAEELHFGRAAERLRMSQPPLSQAIQQLENDVGAVLLERTTRHVALTAAGSAFLDECRALLLHADTVAETPRLVATGLRGRITIGTVASGLSWPLPQALALLRAQAPQIAVRIHEIDTHEVAAGLLDRRIDVALARLSTPRGGIRTEVLLRDEFCALLPQDHALATGTGPLELPALAEEPWVWLPREISPDYHDGMAAACRAAGFSPRVHHWARSIATQIAIVQCGTGVTIIPRASAGALPDGVRARPVSHAATTVALAISSRAQRERAEELLLKHVKAIAAPRTAAAERDAKRSPAAAGALEDDRLATSWWHPVLLAIAIRPPMAYLPVSGLGIGVERRVRARLDVRGSAERAFPASARCPAGFPGRGGRGRAGAVMARVAVRESVTLAGRVEPVRAARAFVGEVLGLGCRAGMAALLVSEISGNSVRHSGSGARGETVAVISGDGTVRVEVTDPRRAGDA